MEAALNCSGVTVLLLHLHDGGGVDLRLAGAGAVAAWGRRGGAVSHHCFCGSICRRRGRRRSSGGGEGRLGAVGVVGPVANVDLRVEHQAVRAVKLDGLESQVEKFMVSCLHAFISSFRKLLPNVQKN